MLVPVEQELRAASARCREALSLPEFHGLNALPGAPRDAQGWFELLSQYNQDPNAGGILRKIKAALPAGVAAAGVKIEHYAALNAFSIAATRIVSETLPDTVKHLYATWCIEIAEKERQWESHFDMDGDPARFLDLAQIATLRRFPAGALNFAYERQSFLETALYIHPLALPGYFLQRLVSMPFTKRALGPHVNYARKHSLILLQTDFERAMWLIAKTIEMNPEVQGINGSSWFYSKTTGDVFPHLAWMRDVLMNCGAYLVDTFPAQPGDGFAYNNRRREILYEQGKFCPRLTAFFLSRNDFLDWASRHPELTPERETPVRAPQRCRCIRIKSPKPARHAKHNSSITLWNGMAALRRIGKLNYMLLVLVVPVLILSLAALLVSGSWFALLTVPIWVFLAFAFQYFFSQ